MGKSCAAGALTLTLALVSPTSADPLLLPGDASLRHDIQLLSDADIIRSPVTTWPMLWPDIARDVLRTDIPEISDGELQAALIRVQRLARRHATRGFSGGEASLSIAREPIVLRTFSDTPREEAEASANASWLGDRAAVRVNATAVTDPDDNHRYRLDGSYLGLALGNFVIAAGSIDRWWGPGWEGSLILSTNARPIPAISIERKYSHAFEWKLLKWLGPWRAGVSLGQLEGSDVPVSDARFFAARASFRPRPWLEFGLSRTAQWCGEGRPCDLSTFGKLLAGRDNRGDSLEVDAEPGNQMAGYDVRIRSPWRAVPGAVYAQAIGEDEAGGLPSRLLGLMGMETWGGSRWGSWRVHVEFADTACNFSRTEPLLDCAYRNTLYPQGYAYRGRPIGHALDSDGRMYSTGAHWVRNDRESWTVRFRRIELDRGSAVGLTQALAASAQNTLTNVELQYNRRFARGELGVGLGFDDQASHASIEGAGTRGFVQWRQGFR